MQSVPSISPPDPLPNPAPDRKDKGDDSFSLLLDAAAQQPDNSAPEAGPPAGDEPAAVPRKTESRPADNGSAPRKTESRPADDCSAQPQDNSGKANASCKRSAGEVPKVDDSTAKAKDPEKISTQPATDDGAQDPAQAVSDPAPSPPQTGTVPAVLIAVNAPKADGGGHASVSGECAKAAAADVAAVPVAPGAPDTPQPSAGTTPPAKEGAAQTAAAIEAAAKAASGPSDTPTESDEASTTPNIPRSGAIAALAEKAAPRATEVAAVVNLGERSELGSKPAATASSSFGKAAAHDDPANAETIKPVSVNESAAPRIAAKAAPDSHMPATAAPQDFETATIRPASLTAELSQPATLPESLHALTSSLSPASAPIQASGAAVPGVPPTSAAIAVEIAAHAKDGSNRFDIRLDPPELGRIDVRLDVGKGGEVSTRLTVDRPETLQILQNDARGLERALQSAGLKTEDGSLQFSLRQQSADGSAGQQAQGGPLPRSGTLYVAEDESASIGVEQYQWAARLRGGVDIRV